MKDLEKTVAAVREKMENEGIPLGRIASVSVNTRAAKRYGLCRRLPDGGFAIEISARLLDDAVPDAYLTDTVAHELLHTAEGCFAHKGRWHELAARLNGRCGFSIRRTADYFPAEKAPPRYVIACRKCGQTGYRSRAGKLVQHPDAYRCSLCGGRLTVSKL